MDKHSYVSADFIQQEPRQQTHHLTTSHFLNIRLSVLVIQVGKLDWVSQQGLPAWEPGNKPKSDHS